MAAVTPSTIIIENFGDTTLHIATFSNINSGSNGDTWTSAIQGVNSYWFQPTDDTTTASMNAVDVTLTTPSTGLFTFTGEEHGRDGQLYVMSQN